jgi:seryl-tRNA(Sec) selenium transferase
VVADRIRLGADLVTFSGDKILGGPQSGLIVGRKPLIAAIAGNPLHRALRCGKLTLAALEATLRIYQQAPDLAATIPSLNMFTQSIADIEALARRVLPLLSATLGPAFRISIDEATSQIGSGALPLDEIPTRVIAIEHDSLTADHWTRSRWPLPARSPRHLRRRRRHPEVGPGNVAATSPWARSSARPVTSITARRAWSRR